MRWRDGIYGWAFNAAVELTEVMRQLGPEQAAFRDALLAVAEGRATRVHYDLFKTRMRSQLSDTELDSFLDAVHLFPTNQKADDHNWTRLRGLGSPIALVKAEHTVAGSTNVSADRFRNLEPHLYLAVGARVFINSNVWTSAGLANGAVGEIMHISWELDDGLPGRRPPNVPVVLYVKLKGYRGPQYFGEMRRTTSDGDEVSDRVRSINGEEVDLTDVVPLAPIEANDDRGPSANSSGQRGAICVRRQLSVKLAFGVTHHKSQEGTLDRVVLDLGTKENNDGQTFTALSRCRDIRCMVIEDCPQERISRIGESTSFSARLQAMDTIRALEDATRQKFGWPALDRPPRPQRPQPSGRGGGGRGRGRAAPRGGGVGRGHGGPRPNATGRPPRLQAALQPWHAYALQASAASPTDSWFYVPLLLEAFGLPATTFRFVRPASWTAYVHAYSTRSLVV